MLPPSHLQIYREFTLNLDVLKDALSQNTVDRSDLKSSVAKLQDFFQTQMLPIQDNELDAHFAHAVRSLQVEIGKQLRLLTLDCLFLQTARQPNTVTQRLAQMGDRLSLLCRYGEQLLALGEWEGGEGGEDGEDGEGGEDRAGKNPDQAQGRSG